MDDTDLELDPEKLEIDAMGFVDVKFTKGVFRVKLRNRDIFDLEKKGINVIGLLMRVDTDLGFTAVCQVLAHGLHADDPKLTSTQVSDMLVDGELGYYLKAVVMVIKSKFKRDKKDDESGEAESESPPLALKSIGSEASG